MKKHEWEIQEGEAVVFIRAMYVDLVTANLLNTTNDVDFYTTTP